MYEVKRKAMIEVMEKLRLSLEGMIFLGSESGVLDEHQGMKIGHWLRRVDWTDIENMDNENLEQYCREGISLRNEIFLHHGGETAMWKKMLPADLQYLAAGEGDYP